MVRASDLTDTASAAVSRATSRLGDLVTPTIRLGVTGLARAGKTVFITSLVRNLLEGGSLPFFPAYADGRIAKAYLEPQPDDNLPRFAYEEHLAALAGDPPLWPESTKRISQLRLTLEYETESSWRWLLGGRRLHVDIVDYPGEWLLDLPLLSLDYRAWSASALALAQAPQRAMVAKPWLDFVAGVEANAPADEQRAIAGARLFRDYLVAASALKYAQSTLPPGRFLLPGELEGSPLLTFCPLALEGDARPPRGSLADMMARRFESYKEHVVKPFFRVHFSRLDRQIVLVDVLSALNGGSAAIADLERALAEILTCFRPGAQSWLAPLLGRRIDRIVFAATKADQLHHASHDRLEAILDRLLATAIARAKFAGADTKVLALAAIRSTREAEMRSGAERLPVIVGVPMPGTRVGGDTFDGLREAAIFPGDLPEDPEVALAAARGPQASAAGIEIVDFRPPRLQVSAATGTSRPPPHIRLDRAIDFLIGDGLA